MTTALMMELPGDGVGVWAGSQLALSLGPDTWDFDTQFGGDTVATHYAVAEDIAAWASDAGRSWAPATFTTSYLEDADTGRAMIRLTYAAAIITWTPNAALAQMMDWTSPTVARSITSDVGVVGTVWGWWAMRGWVQANASPGVVSRTGGYLPGLGTTSPRRPTLEGVLSEAAMLAYTDAGAQASTPRRAHVYQTGESTWRYVALGRGGGEARKGPTRLYRIGLEVMG